DQVSSGTGALVERARDSLIQRAVEHEPGGGPVQRCGLQIAEVAAHSRRDFEVLGLADAQI
ncbi:MAG: hypothetical protein ACRENP_21530, partial [Longimicrobiales bacterium]